MGYKKADPVTREKRQYVRKKKALHLNLIINDSHVALGETIDLSCIGAYCKTTRRIPEMTKLKINMVLPNDDSPVECVGVIVRIDADAHDADICNLAIYFSEINEYERNKIANFLQQA